MRNHILDKPRLYDWTLWVARKLPCPVLYGFARVVGALVFVFSRRDRNHVRNNLEHILADRASPGKVRRLLWNFFQNYAFYMVDFFRLLNMSLLESRSYAQLYEGRHNLDGALARGRGAVILTAHLGHWEIGGLGLRAMGYPVNVVTIKHNSAFTNNLVNMMRTRHQIRVIELGDSAYDGIEIVRALANKEVVAMLGDRVYSDRSGAVDFFGRKVQFPLGPVLLAMAAQAPIVPAFSVMEAPGRYRGVIERALDLQNGPDRDEALRHNLQQVAAVFEEYIRRYPDQWFHVEPI